MKLVPTNLKKRIESRSLALLAFAPPLANLKKRIERFLVLILGFILLLRISKRELKGSRHAKAIAKATVV